MWFHLVTRICELNTKIFARIWHHLAMSKVLQWTELSLIFFAQAAADIESRALLGLIILSVCLDKSRKIQCLRADAVFKCFQLSSFDMFRNHLEHFLKATLANFSRQCWALWCSLGCCGCGEYFVVFFFVLLLLLLLLLFFFFWLLLYILLLLLSFFFFFFFHVPSFPNAKTAPISSFFWNRLWQNTDTCDVLLTFQPQVLIFVMFCTVPAKSTLAFTVFWSLACVKQRKY